MKNDKKKGPQGRELEPTKPLKKMSSLEPSIDERKEKGSWAEVEGKEKQQKKRDDEKVKK